MPNTLRTKLAERIEANTRGAPLGPERDSQLLAEYLSAEPPTSYRKLAAKHDLSPTTVMRALKRAAEVAP